MDTGQIVNKAEIWIIKFQPQYVSTPLLQCPHTLKVKIRINSSQGCWQVFDHNFQAVLWIVGGRGVVMINILQAWPWKQEQRERPCVSWQFSVRRIFFFCHFFVQRLSSGHVFSGHYASRNITGRNNAVKNKSARQKSAERWSGERKSAYKNKNKRKHRRTKNCSGSVARPTRSNSSSIECPTRPYLRVV